MFQIINLLKALLFCIKKKKKAEYLEYRNILHQKLSSAAQEELSKFISISFMNPKIRHPVGADHYDHSTGNR